MAASPLRRRQSANSPKPPVRSAPSATPARPAQLLASAATSTTRDGFDSAPASPWRMRHAGGGTGTPKGRSPPAPKAGAFANSATPAGNVQLRRPTDDDCMFRNVAVRSDSDRDVVIERPNREKASSKATSALVILLLLVSAGLVAVIT